MANRASVARGDKQIGGKQSCHKCSLAFAKWRRHNMRLLGRRRNRPLRQPDTEMQPASSTVDWRSILALNTDEFCRNTSIHGLKYINSRRLHTADR